MFKAASEQLSECLVLPADGLDHEGRETPRRTRKRRPSAPRFAQYSRGFHVLWWSKLGSLGRDQVSAPAPNAPSILVACGFATIGTLGSLNALRDAGVTVVGGFQSPMEQEVLWLLFRRRQPVIVPANHELIEIGARPLGVAALPMRLLAKRNG